MDEPPQATWKRVRPVLLTTIVPVAAALGFFALATYANTKGDVTKLPSMAAYDACLTANDLQPAQSYATDFDRQVAGQQMMKVCGDKIPPEIIKKWQKEAQAARGSFRECMENLGGSRSRGFGRFRGQPSTGFRDAYVTCRGLLQGNSEDGGVTPPAPKTTPAPGPIA